MGRICVSCFQRGQLVCSKVENRYELWSHKYEKLELSVSSGRGIRNELVTEAVCLGAGKGSKDTDRKPSDAQKENECPLS